MNERNAVKEELTKAFEKKHRAFLSELEQMPAGTKEEKEERRKFFKKYPLKDDFQMEAMQAYRPGAYKRFMERLADPHKSWEKGYAREQDTDIASAKNKQDIATLAFVEAINKAVCSYTGINRKGERYSFLACLGVIYRQAAEKEAAKNDLAEAGISDTGIPERNLQRIVRLARATRTMMQREGIHKPSKEVLDKLQEAVSYKCTKKELELVQALVFHTNLQVSISPREDEDGEALEYYLPDERYGNQEVEDREAARNILKEFCENIERKWDMISSGKELREKNTIRLFFSSNMLKELKLDGNGKPYPKEPAGDEGFYLLLEPQGDFLYREMLYEKYLHRALVEYPENFYEVYVKLLRRDFDFSDTLIANLEGKNKSSISRAREKYVELVRALCVYYREDEY